MREFLSEITNPAGVTVRVGEGFAEVLRFSGSYRGIWRDEGRCIISGFHSPIEKECLLILLRGNQPVAALADEVVFAHVAPGGHLDELRRLVAGWGIPLRSLNDVPSSH